MTSNLEITVVNNSQEVKPCWDDQEATVVIRLILWIRIILFIYIDDFDDKYVPV